MSKINLILTFFALSLMLMSPGQSNSCRSSKVSNAVQQKTNQVATGIWGGVHIQMQVTESGAQIEYDCAHASLDEPLTLNSEGRLDVKGTYVGEGGGPIRQGEIPEGQPARFTGSVEGKTMTLTVTLTDTGKSAGTYTLTQGARGRVVKCQ